MKKNNFAIQQKIESDFHLIYIVSNSINQKSLIKYVKGFRRTKNTIKDIYKKLENIKHNNLIEIYDVVTIKDDFFVHMQYVKGKTLNQYIKRKYYYINDKSLNILKNLFTNIAITIDFLHKNNIVHTDIIGANIMVDDELKITIIDFDFALILDKEIDGAVNIDIYGFVVMFSQILYEQIYLNKNYSLFNNDNISIKKNILKDFISKKGLEKYTTCMAFIEDIFKNNNKVINND